MDYIFSNIKFFLLNEVDSLFIFDPLCKKKNVIYRIWENNPKISSFRGLIYP